MPEPGGASWKQAFAANPWLRAQVVILIVAVVYMPVAAVLAVTFGSLWVLAPVAAYATAGAVCWVPSRRRDRALKAARSAVEAEAAELRTPHAPDAGPDQCPVCGLFGLNALAADDAFMERGEAAKVVAWGRKRAHWECAEFVPYVAPPHFSAFEVDGHKTYCACARCEPSATYPGVYSRCRFCGFYRRAESMEAAKAYLIEHAKTCPKRPRPTAREIKAEFEALDARIRQQSAELDWMLRDKSWKRRD